MPQERYLNCEAYRLIAAVGQQPTHKPADGFAVKYSLGNGARISASGDANISVRGASILEIEKENVATRPNRLCCNFGRRGW